MYSHKYFCWWKKILYHRKIRIKILAFFGKFHHLTSPVRETSKYGWLLNISIHSLGQPLKSHGNGWKRYTLHKSIQERSHWLVNWWASHGYPDIPVGSRKTSQLRLSNALKFVMPWNVWRGVRLLSQGWPDGLANLTKGPWVDRWQMA